MVAEKYGKSKDSFEEKYSPVSSNEEIGPENLPIHHSNNITEQISDNVDNQNQTDCTKYCRPCLRKYRPDINNPFLCPPIGWLADIIIWILILLFIWGIMWAVLKEEAELNGHFFALYLLTILCSIGGWLITFAKLPPLLGMLLVGVALRNIPYIDFGKNLNKNWSIALRNIALVVILIRAGLGLDPNVLRRLKIVCLRLACLPCLCEATSVGILSHFILGFEWLWGFMLGFVIAAVSPAVIVPSLLTLQNQGFGVDKGIPTIIIAAASMDDVLAISGFSILLGITFSNSNLIFTIFRGPLEVVMGLAYGCFIGILMWFIPSETEKKMDLYRLVLLFSGGLFAVFVSKAIEFSGAGALGCLVLAFVAGLGWKRKGMQNQNPISNGMADLWVLFQPVLFGLIGAEIDVSKLEGQTVGLGLAVVFISLAIRMCVSILAVFGGGLNMKEKLFVAVAWLPKATVQAAIGSLALDTARERNAGKDKEELGLKILIIAVLVILITAPIGAAAIALTAPKLLTKSQTTPNKTQNNEVELSLIES